MENYNQEGVSVGNGADVPISELHLVANTVRFERIIVYDPPEPDGTLRQLLGIGRLSRLGWTASNRLKSGMTSVNTWATQEGLLYPNNGAAGANIYAKDRDRTTVQWYVMTIEEP